MSPHFSSQLFRFVQLLPDRRFLSLDFDTDVDCNSFNECFIASYLYLYFWNLIEVVFNQIDLYFDELFVPVEIIKLLATLVWKLRIHYASIAIFLWIFVYRQCFVFLFHIVILKIMAWISISTMGTTILSLNKTNNILKIKIDCSKSVFTLIIPANKLHPWLHINISTEKYNNNFW